MSRWRKSKQKRRPVIVIESPTPLTNGEAEEVANCVRTLIFEERRDVITIAGAKLSTIEVEEK